MSDESDSGMAEEEKKTSDLLALLYPEEGSEVDASAFEGDEELESMRGLRSLFADMPEEEAPSAVSNKLLAMAAQHAPKQQEEGVGFFAWLNGLFMPLVAHPGLAAAASLVLVAGVAGTLYLTGGAKVAEPTVSSQAEPPTATAESSSRAPAAEPAATPEREAAAEEALAEVESEADPASGEDISATAGLQDSGKKAEERAPLRKKKRKRKSAKGATVVGGSPGGAARGTGGGGFGKSSLGAEAGDKDRRSREDYRRVKDIVTVDEKPEDAPAPRKTRREQQKAPPKKSPPRPKPARRPSPEPAPPPAPSSDGDDSTSSEDEEEAEAPQAPAPNRDTPSASSLHKQAVTAAKKGDCSKVKSIGRQIRRIDSAYYDRTFLADQKLRACRAAKK